MNLVINVKRKKNNKFFIYILNFLQIIFLTNILSVIQKFLRKQKNIKALEANYYYYQIRINIISE